MSEIIIVSVLIACAVAFIVTLMHKWGAVEYMQLNADKLPKLIVEMSYCDFCLCWWCSVLVAVVALFITFNISVLLCPIFATPIAKFLLR